MLMGFAAALVAVSLAAPGQVVEDGSFELGTPNPVWDEHSQNFPSPVCNVQRCGNFFGDPYDGDWWVWFGGIEQEETGWMRQKVTIPRGAATLTFWLDITASSGNRTDFLSVSIDDEEVFKALESDAGRYHPWTQVRLDISDFADDGEHLLSFDSTITGPRRSNFFLDLVEIVVEGGGTCVYVVKSTPKGKKGCPNEFCPARNSSFDSGIVCGPPDCPKKQKINKLDCPEGRGFCKKVKLAKPQCRS
ncbi:MAG: hypothetical protein C4547_12650 [Phycisphaerales bacterium]|nr:MAG: hypothetical protein C4547_12650 [Phycisphaerales bacterium]